MGNLDRDRHRLAAGHQGVLLRFRDAGRDWAVKCPCGSGLAARFHAAGLRREFRAYRRLAGVPGIPVCHGLAAGRYLVLDHLTAVPYRQAKIADREDWFRRLYELILTIHARGVAHGDLKRKANLCAGEDGQPWILDFGTAHLRRPGFHPLNHALFDYLAQTDLNAWAKHKHGGDYAKAAAAEPGILRYSRLEAAVSAWRKRRDRRRAE